MLLGRIWHLSRATSAETGQGWFSTCLTTIKLQMICNSVYSILTYPPLQPAAWGTTAIRALWDTRYPTTIPRKNRSRRRPKKNGFSIDSTTSDDGDSVKRINDDKRNIQINNLAVDLVIFIQYFSFDQFVSWFKLHLVLFVAVDSWKSVNCFDASGRRGEERLKWKRFYFASLAFTCLI